MFEKLNHLSFKVKIIFLIASVSLIAIFTTSFISFRSSKSALLDSAYEQLDSIKIISKKRTTDFFERTKTFTKLLAKDRLSEGLMLAYESAFFATGLPLGKDHKITSESFDKLNTIYHDKTHEQLKSYQLANYFLVNIQGQVVFSTMIDKEGKILGRNLLKGELANSKLGKCVESALKGKYEDVFNSDYEFQKKLSSVKSFYCSKMIAEFPHLSEGIQKGDVMGVIVTEVDDNVINTLLNERAGMGKTGQSYLVGHDGLLRSSMYINSNKFNLNNSHINNLKISYSSVQKALNGKPAGHEVVLNHEDKEVAVSFDTFIHEGTNWAIVVEKESEEIFSSTSSLMRTLLLITTILLIIIVVLGVYVSNLITTPILESINTLAEICNNLKNDSTDLNATASTLKETADSQNRALESTVQSMEEITATITQNSSNAESSNQMSNSSLKTVQFGKVVVNELNQAMNEISHSNRELLNQIDHSNAKISEIVTLINEIEAKTKIINDIVFQTKLLSFNASVESARAGEHGKGFSVVAEEIGNLATVSGDSAKEISEMLSQSNDKVQKIIHETKARVNEISSLSDTKIKSGQEVANKCAQVFEEINQNVDQVSRLMNEITLASKEQSQGIGSINSAMSNLSTGTSQSAEMANKSFQASELLKHRSQKLDELLYVFETVIHGRK